AAARQRGHRHRPRPLRQRLGRHAGRARSPGPRGRRRAEHRPGRARAPRPRRADGLHQPEGARAARGEGLPGGGRGHRHRHGGEHPHHRCAVRPRHPPHLGEGDHRVARAHPGAGRRAPRRVPRARHGPAGRPPRDRPDDGLHRARRGLRPGRDVTAGARRRQDARRGGHPGQVRGDRRLHQAGGPVVHLRHARHGDGGRGHPPRGRREAPRRELRQQGL
ncbi:MAG: KtrAB potassium uptake system, peripheral membrane component KtrA, partial [uncultured Acidimicrobiales bacterium]